MRNDRISRKAFTCWIFCICLFLSVSSGPNPTVSHSSSSEPPRDLYVPQLVQDEQVSDKQNRILFDPLFPEFLETSNTAGRYTAIDSATLDSLITIVMGNYHIPGLAACIVKDGLIVWNRTFGYADIIDSVEVADTTLFMLASISKTFVAVAMMQLWEEGLFGLDDDINDYLPFPVVNPYYPDSTITFRMLLAHTSSIARNDTKWYPSLLTWGDDSPIPLDQFLQDWLVPGGAYYEWNNYKIYPPGTIGEYSNIAYTLAGFLVEIISGQSFESYCQNHIFAPLGMDETSWFLSELNVDHIAVPTWHDGGSYVAYGHFGFPVYPAGQLRTSSIQLARHLIAFMQLGQIDGVRILDGTTVELMTTIQYPDITVIPGVEWGLGWYRVNTDYGRLWGHDGGIAGVITVMYYHPLENYGVIMLSNTNGNQGHGIIASQIFDFASNLGTTPVQLVSFSAARRGRDALLTWEITHAEDFWGFHVWRRQKARDELIRISNELISGRVVYEYLDVSAPTGETEYWLQEVGIEGEEIWLGSATLEAVAGTPGLLSLAQNYPNPFNPQTTISFTLPSEDRVNLTIFDVEGKLVRTLVDEPLPGGSKKYIWDGKDDRGNPVSSGVYLYRLKAGKKALAKKMLFVK